jgi:hypothetical protein
MNRFELMKRVNALIKLQSGLMDAIDGLPEEMSSKVGALLDQTWDEIRRALNTYYEGQR